MSDLIRRSDAIDTVEELNRKVNDSREFDTICTSDVLRRVNALPSAEAVHKPDYSYEADMVRRMKEALLAKSEQGEWIITKEGEYDGRGVYKTVCSKCGHETFYKANKAHFCPNCGARMKGAEHEID